MHFIPNEVYHVYNRGNKNQIIFFNENNYIFFLKKVRVEWRKYGDILAYCLMPNHFHFMIVPNEEACKNILLGDRWSHMQNLSKSIGKTLSSYTKAINIQNQVTGNLFQKKTKAKCLSEEDGHSTNGFIIKDYALTCFHYIHQNPLQAGLVKELKDWKYSSYPDYYDHRDGTLCNKMMTMRLLSLSPIDFKKEYGSLNKKVIDKLF